MANHRFGKLADVWKHLPLTEIVHLEQPGAYWESHAGSALYPMVDDPERIFGAQRFLRVSADYPTLHNAHYRQQLLRHATAEGTLTSYPGSPMPAMSDLGAGHRFLFCDVDPASVASVDEAARALRLGSSVTAVVADGMAALRPESRLAGGAGSVVAHIDRGVGLVYWYGHSVPEERAWAFEELARRCPSAILWCGHVLVALQEGHPVRGDLGTATTSGTGFGIVGANLQAETLRTCERLGQELALAYDGAGLPGGGQGRLDFQPS
jgi:hypothetical protein